MICPLLEQVCSKIPPPRQRLCAAHARPITPSRYRRGCRTTGCSRCSRTRARCPEAKKRRADRYDLSRYTRAFVSCTKHPNRRCSRSLYVRSGSRRCRSCSCKRTDGTIRPSRRRALRRHYERWRRTFRGKILRRASQQRRYQIKTLGWAPAFISLYQTGFSEPKWFE